MAYTAYARVLKVSLDLSNCFNNEKKVNIVVFQNVKHLRS